MVDFHYLVKPERARKAFFVPAIPVRIQNTLLIQFFFLVFNASG